MEEVHDAWRGVRRGRALEDRSCAWSPPYIVFFLACGRVKAKSGELVVSEGDGVWKTRTIQRRPLDETWNRSAIDLVKHFPLAKGKDVERAGSNRSVSRGK